MISLFNCQFCPLRSESTTPLQERKPWAQTFPESLYAPAYGWGRSLSQIGLQFLSKDMTPKPKFSTGDEVVIVDTEIFGPDTPIKNGDVGIIYSIVPNHATDTEACYRIELEAENTLVWESQIEYKDTPPEPEHHQEPAPPATDSTPEPTEEQPLEIVEVGVTLFYKRPGRDGAEKGLGVNARARVPVGIDWADVQDQVYEAQRQQLTQLFSRGGRRG